MSSLEALGIAGFRSYSTETLQKIEFKVPLTLIWGKNGSGKTVIPPSSRPSSKPSSTSPQAPSLPHAKKAKTSSLNLALWESPKCPEKFA
jgi:hypothetical protein